MCSLVPAVSAGDICCHHERKLMGQFLGQGRKEHGFSCTTVLFQLLFNMPQCESECTQGENGLCSASLILKIVKTPYCFDCI